MIYIFLAQGFEETEYIATADVLLRGGAQVTTVAIDDIEVTGAHGITIKADCNIYDCDFSDGEMFVLPGGMPGTNNLQDCEELIKLLKDAYKKGKYIGAICAAPKILGELGFLEGRDATCYPGFEQFLEGANVVDKSVAHTGNIITANGMGGAIEFGLKLLEVLGKDHLKVKKDILYNE